MARIRFALVGSGWRSLYYVRIARALQDACIAILLREAINSGKTITSSWQPEALR